MAGPQRIPEAIGRGDRARQRLRIDQAGLAAMQQQPAQQRGQRSARRGQMQVRVQPCPLLRRADHHQPRAAIPPRRLYPVDQHGMIPHRRVADHQDGRRPADILIAGRHDILAIGGALRGRDRPAPGRMDVRGPEKALQQLVGDIIILGGQGAADMQRDAARPMARQHRRQTPRQLRDRLVPWLASPIHKGVQQPPVQRPLLLQPLRPRAQQPAIGGMSRVALQMQATLLARHRANAAADRALSAQASHDRHGQRALRRRSDMPRLLAH